MNSMCKQSESFCNEQVVIYVLTFPEETDSIEHQEAAIKANIGKNWDRNKQTHFAIGYAEHSIAKVGSHAVQIACFCELAENIIKIKK